MKKYDFKKLLILLLALVLVIGLVACNKPADTVVTPPDDTVKLTAENYFTALWQASKSIGATPIPNTSDMNFSIGLEVDLAVKTGATTSIEYKLGIDIKAVYDRAGENAGKYSAATIQIKDLAKNSNLLSVFYYLDEPTKIYVNAYDQKICLQFQADEAESADPNGVVAGNLTKFLTDKLVAGNGEFLNGKSIDDIIILFTSNFGPDFDLDDVLDLLLQFMGMDMAELIDMIRGFIDFPVADENSASLLDVLNGLGGVAVNGASITKTQTDTGFTWSADLAAVVKTLITKMTDNIVNEANTTINISFKTDANGGNLDDLAVSLVRTNVAANTSVEVKIRITELSATPTTAVASGTGQFGMTKADFKSDYKLNLDATVSIADAMLKVTYADDGEDNFASVAALYSDTVPTIEPLAAQEFAGQLRIEADAFVNLLADDSTTAAYAQVFYKANAGTEKSVVKASFENLDGVGTAKIWMDETEYAVIARDYLILNLVKSLHNSNEYTALVEGNPTREELLAGSNGAAIIALINALNSTASTYEITGLELQTLLWDLFFVEDEKKEVDTDVTKVFTGKNYIAAAVADGYVLNNETHNYDKTVGGVTESKSVAELYTLSKLPVSGYKFDFDLFAILKTVLAVSSQSTTNAFAITMPNTLADTLLKPVSNSQLAVTNFGIFSTMWSKVSGVISYESFESQDDIYAWFYKGNQNVINRMTERNIIPAIKLVRDDAKGAYGYNDKFVLVEAAKAVGTARYNIERSMTAAVNALVGNGTWFYQNSSTITKDEARKMWAAATNTWTFGKDNLAVQTIENIAIDVTTRAAIYAECIEDGLLATLDGSSFIGGARANADNGEWLDNILQGKLNATISYVTTEGLTINVSFTDVATKVASVALTIKLEALTTPYVVPADADLDFEAECTIDLSSYMDQIRADYEAQNA
ncbi:MAG TPA: hypothetical protein VJZ69_05325 [Clostridia bacterium]|nr:hypothetical protein [Clostridia bacterium]